MNNERNIDAFTRQNPPYPSVAQTTTTVPYNTQLTYYTSLSISQPLGSALPEKMQKKNCLSQQIVSIGTRDPQASHTSGRLIRQVNRSCQSEVGLNECHQ